VTWDTLLHWLSQSGEGSWAGFRRAVTELSPDDTDRDGALRRLRVALSDLGHVEFFIGGSPRWRVLPPFMGTIVADQPTMQLCGARVPRLLAALRESAAANGCRLIELPGSTGLTVVRIDGSAEAFEAIATGAGMEFVHELADALCNLVVTIPQSIEGAIVEPALDKWLVRSFDLRQLTWVDGLIPHSACEYQSRYGDRRYYVHTRRGLLRLPKREAVYASAALRRIELASYDPQSGTLSVPGAAPLPEAYARVACLCSGALGRFESGRLVHDSVPLHIGRFVCAALGQKVRQWQLTASEGK